MIDKAEQRRRAEEMSKQLAAQGLEAPKLTYPVSNNKPVRGPSDKLGVEIKVGQKVARATCSSNTAHLHVQTVTKVDGYKVYLDNSPQALRNLNNVLVLK